MDKKLGQHGVFWQIQTTKQDEDKRDRSYTTTPLPNFPRDSSDTASALYQDVLATSTLQSVHLPHQLIIFGPIEKQICHMRCPSL